MEFSLGMLSTGALSLLALLIGKFLKSKISLFRKFYIPDAVIGGLVVAIIILIFNLTGVLVLKFDTTLQSVAMTLFFATVGYMASLNDLKKGGIGVVALLVMVALLIAFQNLIGVGLAAAFGQNKLYGLLMGSVSLSGGHGTASAWGGVLEGYGAENGQIIAYAAATFGLVIGGLIGGPVAKILFKTQCHGQNDTIAEQTVTIDEKKELKADRLATVFITLLICAGLSEFVNPYFTQFLHLISKDLSLPSYILAMIFAAVVRNVTEAIYKKQGKLENLPITENDVIGSVALDVFLSIAMTTLDLSTLVKMSSKLIWLFLNTMAVQTVFVMMFVGFATYYVMRWVCKSKYTATVVCAGHCGFGMGSTPTAIANMDAFCKINGQCTQAYLIVPIVGAMFLDFVNALIISVYVGVLV